EPSIESEVIKIVPKKYSRITYLTIKNIYLLFSQRNRIATSIARKFGSKVDFGDTRIGRLNVEEMIQLARSIKVF
ncbi:MAG: hypothetical protein ACJ72U_15230, partial [Nitrososphaeraceae archaeon]